MSSYLTEILSNLLSNDEQYRKNGEAGINMLATNKFSKFLYDLATYVSESTYQIKHRQLAATVFKNLINKIDTYKDKWIQINPIERTIIKEIVLNTLASPDNLIRKSVAVIIASEI